MNNHFYNRYLQLITKIQSLGKRELVYSEVHHIIPKCLGGNDNFDNLIELSYREHFLAHWMLFNAFLGKHLGIMYSFIRMCDQNPKNLYKKQFISFEKGFISRNFEKKKIQTAKLISEKNKKTMVCYDLLLQKNVKIQTYQYYLDISRYITTSKNKVLAKDNSGNNVFICREEYNNGNYTGQTKGLTAVFDSHTNKFVQITTDEFQKNRERYSGGNTNKCNVINMITGRRGQIAKDEFDKNIYIGLGDKSQYFKCQHIKSKKEKNISIFEWHLVKNEWNIIDNESFERAQIKWKKL